MRAARRTARVVAGLQNVRRTSRRPAPGPNDGSTSNGRGLAFAAVSAGASPEWSPTTSQIPVAGEHGADAGEDPAELGGLRRPLALVARVGGRGVDRHRAYVGHGARDVVAILVAGVLRGEPPRALDARGDEEADAHDHGRVADDLAHGERLLLGDSCGVSGEPPPAAPSAGVSAKLISASPPSCNVTVCGGAEKPATRTTTLCVPSWTSSRATPSSSLPLGAPSTSTDPEDVPAWTMSVPVVPLLVSLANRRPATALSASSPGSFRLSL